jgi:hypothetical protein
MTIALNSTYRDDRTQARKATANQHPRPTHFGICAAPPLPHSAIRDTAVLKFDKLPNQ